MAIELITAQEVIDISFTNSESAELGLVKEAMIRAAEIRWIKPVLGNDLWDLLDSEYPNYSAANQRLVDKLVTPLSFFVKHELVSDMSINQTASELQVLTTEFSQPATASQRGEIQEQAKKHGEALLNEVVRWIEKESIITDYPDYSASNSNNKIKGGLIL